MYVELKKIKLSKSIIQQIQYADYSSIINQGEILGWCYWNFGTSSKKVTRNLILFTNKNGDIKKFVMFDEIKDTTYQYDIDPFNSVLGRKTKHRVDLKRSRMNSTEYTFDDENEKKIFIDHLEKLKNISIDKGQFFY